MEPKITIVTCSYWRPDLLRRAIQSVQNQTFKDYEHIIVSDHDPFARYVYNDFKEDTRIRFIENPNPYEYNLGAVSFKIGLENAKSDYFCYLLDDDIIYENHLEEHYTHFKKGNIIGNSNFDCIEFNGEDQTVKFIASKSLKELQAIPVIPGSGSYPDVSRISHTVEKGREIGWKTQTELTGGRIRVGNMYEDNQFMSKLGLNTSQHLISATTSLKCCWGGVPRSKETKGVDQEYLDSLMKKLVEDSTDTSGYRLISDTPYVYPELKDSLLGETQ